MFDDIYKNIRLSMSERLSSPLMTSFVISWLIWNYRFVLIVFSSESIDEKLFLIDKEIVFGWEYFKEAGFFYPLLSSFFYVFIYPFPSMFVYGFHMLTKKWILNIRRMIEGKTLLSKDDTDLMMELYDKKIKHYLVLIDEKDTEIEKLNSILARRASEISDLSKEYELSVRSLNRIDKDTFGYYMKVLIFLEKSEGCALMNYNLGNGSQVEHEYYIQEMIKDGLVESYYDDYVKGEMIRFSHKGRKFLMGQKKIQDETFFE